MHSEIYENMNPGSSMKDWFWHLFITYVTVGTGVAGFLSNSICQTLHLSVHYNEIIIHELQKHKNGITEHFYLWESHLKEQQPRFIFVSDLRHPDTCYSSSWTSTTRCYQWSKHMNHCHQLLFVYWSIHSFTKKYIYMNLKLRIRALTPRMFIKSFPIDSRLWFLNGCFKKDISVSNMAASI